MAASDPNFPKGTDSEPSVMDDYESPLVDKVALVSVNGVVTVHDSEDDAVAAWAADSSHVTTVKVPRKGEDE